MIRGHNADPLHEHSGDHRLEFFSKAGSLFTKKSKKNPQGRTAYYGTDASSSALALFQPMWMMKDIADRVLAMKLLFWLRDPRGGAGNRSGFRECLAYLATQAPDGMEWLGVNLPRIPEYGRWDDLRMCWGTKLEPFAARIWADALTRQDHLAAKWAKVDMVPLQRALKTNEHGLRKLVVPARASVVERAMCAKDWDAITYPHVPSKAMAMYTKAFKRRDPLRFEAYKKSLIKGTTKINASVLFPHDCAVQALKDTTIAEAQFASLPDYIGNTDRRIMALADTSGSMSAPVCAGVNRRMVAVSLALYCSDRLGERHPWYRKYMEFESTPYFVDWRGKSFCDAVRFGHGYIGSTNVQKALDALLNMAIRDKLAPSEMVTTLLIISDMQFDQHANSGDYICTLGGSVSCEGTERTVVENCMARWEAAGYARPTIVFWNLEGYAGQPAQLTTPNTALVSGFSPAILKSVLSGKTVTPTEVLIQAVEKYQIEIPYTGE